MQHILKRFLLILVLTVQPIASHAESLSKPEAINTQGVHHVGLAVRDLDITAQFFINALHFNKVDERPDYPAIFVSDGNVLVTLWQVRDKETATAFDRKNNIGLHHLAFTLGSIEELHVMHEKLKNWPGITIDFAPELVGEGPAMHMMFYEPGGIRLELLASPK